MVLFLTNSDALGSTNNFRNWVNDSTFLKSNEVLTHLDEWHIRVLFLKSVNAEIFFQRWKKGHIKDMFLKETFFVFWGWSVVYLKLYAAYIIKIHYHHHFCRGFSRLWIFTGFQRIFNDFLNLSKGLKDFYGFWNELFGSFGWTK